MNNEELKKKIVDILDNKQTHGASLQRISVDGPIKIVQIYTPNEDIADALISAGIGEAEYERYVFKKAYIDFFTRLNRDKKFRKNFDNVTLGCQIRKFEDMIEQAEKELAEEKKDECQR